MGIRTLTIHDVPKEIRASGAANVKKRLQQLLSNPLLTSEQKKELREQIQYASKWESLEVPVQPKNEVQLTPVSDGSSSTPHHQTVELVEQLTLEEQ